MSLYATDELDSSGGRLEIAAVAQSVASNTRATVTDYNNHGTTRFTADLNPGSYPSYQDMALNASGTAHINKNGVTAFLVATADDLDNAGLQSQQYLSIYHADETGTAYDPVLVIESTAGTTSSSTVESDLQNLTYTYDSVGNITQIVDAANPADIGTTTYAYDDLYRLLVATSTYASSSDYVRSYSYNIIGNILTASDLGTYLYEGTAGASYANPHAPTSIGSSTYVYDQSGNVTSGDNATNTWSYRNELFSQNNGGTTTTYGYDHTGARVIKTVGGVSTLYPNKYFEIKGATTTKYIWAGNELVAYVEGNGAGTSTYYIHSDHLSSTNVITDSMGTVDLRKSYLPFGSEHAATGNSSIVRGYIGQYEEDNDLSYLNARYYKGTRGQFLSQDPVYWEMGQSAEGKVALRNPQMQNSYSYAFNNPINYKDSNGEFAFLAIPAVYAPQILATTLAIANSALLTSWLAEDLATLFDPNASGGEKAFIVGMSLTGPGAKAGSALVKNGDKLVPVFRGGSGNQLFKIKSNEIKVDADGFVVNTRGVSVNTNASSLDRFGGANQIEYLPDTLRINQIGNVNHYEIVPIGKLTPDEFQSELEKIKTSRVED